MVQALYPILDAEMAAAHGHDLVACAREFAGMGLARQQLRAKTLAGRDFLALAERLVEVVPQLLVNDRADIARLAGAAGVHVGQDDLPLDMVRRLGPAGWTVGVSTHNLEQAAAALLTAPDYLAVGPIYATRSKLHPDPVVGTELVREVRRRTRLPLVAIGGIGLDNCAAVWAAGADAVAVIGALWQSDDPTRVAREFALAFERFSCHSPEK
ncbi:MAG: thiamine phosphate synthase [Terriglobales bacterium]